MSVKTRPGYDPVEGAKSVEITMDNIAKVFSMLINAVSWILTKIRR